MARVAGLPRSVCPFPLPAILPLVQPRDGEIRRERAVVLPSDKVAELARATPLEFPLVFAVPVGIIVSMKAHFQSGRLGEWPSRLKSEFLSRSHFTPISLKSAFNVDRRDLNGPLKPVDEEVIPFGLATFQGIPFELGLPDQPNLILLDKDEIVIDGGESRATYILFLHAVEDRRVGSTEDLEDFAGTALMDAQGNELGDLVSEYSLEYADGTRFIGPILRRFAIQQSRITWGASPFSAVTALRPEVFPTTTDEQILGRVPQETYGRGENTPTQFKRPGKRLGLDLCPAQSDPG